MADKTISGGSANDGVIIINAIDPITGAPSKSPGDVNIMTSAGVTVTELLPGLSNNHLSVDLGDGNDVLIAKNMPWANLSRNDFDVINMGSGNDYVELDRSAVLNTLNTGTGDDTVILRDSYVKQLELGDGNDKLTAGPGGANISQEEAATKAANAALVQNYDGGNGSDTLNLIGDWTVTLSSGFVTLDLDGTVDGNGLLIASSVFSSAQMSLVTGFPPTMGGTVSWGASTVGTVTLHNTATFQNFEQINAVCFTAGTMIETPEGLVAIETLKAGDRVMTQNGVKPIVWIGKRRLDVVDLAANRKMLPVRIPADAFGAGLPSRDISFSPQHRVVVRSKIAERMFGAQEVLVSVKDLVGYNGIDVDGSVREVVYVHMMFDEHTCVQVSGIEAETMYPGAEAFKMVTKDSLTELRAIFGEEIDAIMAGDLRKENYLPFVKGRDARALAARHAKNGAPLYA